MDRPKFIISRQKVLEQYEKVREIADYVSYSSKTNPLVTGILERECGECRFSIHMKSELKNVKDKSRVLFLAQAWNREEIKELVEMGVRWFVIDNESDLEVLIEFLKNSEECVNLLLRVKLKENTLRTEKYFVFGMSKEVVERKLVELRKNSRIGKLGLHFHRKTQNMAEWNLQEEFEGGEILDLDVLEELDLVCVGGGLPAEYANTNVDVISRVLEKLKGLREWLNSKSIGMMVEPGRFIAAPAGNLITRVIGMHGENLIVNASVYNSDLDALIVPVKLKVEGEMLKNSDANNQPTHPERVKRAYVIKGVTPCSMDIFRYRVYLPEKKVGDEIVFLNAGAYNFGTDFCDLDRVESVVF